MLDHSSAGLLNRETGPAAVEAGEEPAGKGSRPALPTSLRRNYTHATPILRGLGCNCNVAKPSGQRWGPPSDPRRVCLLGFVLDAPPLGSDGGVGNDVTHRVLELGSTSRHERSRGQGWATLDGGGVDEYLVTVLGVELEQRQEGIGPIGLLGRQEGTALKPPMTSGVIDCIDSERSSTKEMRTGGPCRSCSSPWDSSSPRAHARAPSGWYRSSPGLRRCPLRRDAASIRRRAGD